MTTSFPRVGLISRIFILASLVMLPFAGPVMGQSPRAAGKNIRAPYETAVENALQKAQDEVIKHSDLWVDHSQWEHAWKVKSGPYMVKTTESRQLGLRMGRRLETMLAEFTNLLKPGYEPDKTFEILIMPDLGRFNQYGNDHAEYHSSIYGSFLAIRLDDRPVALLYDQNETLMTMYATHSALHQFVDHAFRNKPPTWIDEGLASYFAIRWAYSWGVSQVKGIIDNGSFIPLSELFAKPIDQYVDISHTCFMELGMFFYYLLHFREDTCSNSEGVGPFAVYLRAVLNGDNRSNLPFNDLITNHLDELEADFKAFDFPQQ